MKTIAVTATKDRWDTSHTLVFRMPQELETVDMWKEITAVKKFCDELISRLVDLTLPHPKEECCAWVVDGAWVGFTVSAVIDGDDIAPFLPALSTKDIIMKSRALLEENGHVCHRVGL